MKGLYKNPTANIIVNVTDWTFFSDQEEDKDFPVLPLIFNILWEGLARKMRQGGKKASTLEKKEVKLSLLIDDMV